MGPIRLVVDRGIHNTVILYVAAIHPGAVERQCDVAVAADGDDPAGAADSAQLGDHRRGGCEGRDPDMNDVGGDFVSVPICRSAKQTGCLVTFKSYRAELPPTPFGGLWPEHKPGMVTACVNPAAVGGGSAVLRSYFASGSESIIGNTLEVQSWVTPPVTIATPFVRVPGLVQAQCATNDMGTYLAISVTPEPGDTRTSTISGDVIANGKVVPGWGLHVVDINLVMGDLLELIASESKTYLAERKPQRPSTNLGR